MIRKAIIISLTEKYISIIITLISSMLLARLLTPKEFGIFAIASIFIFIADIIQNVGVPNFVIKEKKLTKNKIQSANLLTVIFGIITAISLYLSAPLIAEIYLQPELKNILEVVSFVLVLAPFSTIKYALLRRELALNGIAIANIVSMIGGTLLTIYLAYNKYGVMSLAYGAICQRLLKIISIQFFKANMYILGFSLKHLKEIFSFSKNFFAASVLAQLGNTSPTWILGKLYGVDNIGQFSRAHGTVDILDNMIVQGVKPVIAPVIANKNNAGEDISFTIYKLINIQVAILWPLYIMLAIYADDVVLLLFGSQWNTAAQLLPWFCIGSSISCIVALLPEVIAGLGFSKAILKIQATIQTFRIFLLLIPFVVKIDFIYFISIFLVIVPVINVLLFFYYLQKYKYISLKNILSSIPIGIVFCSMAPILISNYVFGIALTNFMQTSIAFLTSLFIWLLLNYKFNIYLKVELSKLILAIKKIT